MYQFANVLYHQDKWQGAEQLHREALKGRPLRLGEDHPDTLTSMNNLANVLSDQGKWQEAEELHREALEGMKPRLGEDHPDTLSSMDNLANVQTEFGRKGMQTAHNLSEASSQTYANDAVENRRKAVEGLEAKYGVEHPDALRARCGLAGLLAERGHLEEAIAELRKALPGMRALYGDHPWTCQVAQELERLEAELKTPDELQRNLKDVEDVPILMSNASLLDRALELERRGSKLFAWIRGLAIEAAAEAVPGISRRHRWQLAGHHFSAC